MSSINKKGDPWSPFFYKNSPIFEFIFTIAESFKSFPAWPKHHNYNQLLHKVCGNITSSSGTELKFIPQDIKPTSIDDEYEVRIYKFGEIQTRLFNWHDFFQVMAWCRFPKTKKIINQLHSQALIKRRESAASSQRSHVENTLTLFDECGAIIVCSNNKLIDIIKKFSWRQLFITNRNAFETELKCIIFGHALYEKALNPYIGMTAHCIILNVDHDFFKMNSQAQYEKIDKLAAKYFSQLETIDTSILQPFPILGIPGWDQDNSNPEYYNNENYFRRKPIK